MSDLQLTYKKKYEATKNKWIWTADRPDFLNAAKNSLQQSDVSRGCFALDIIILYFPKFCCSNLVFIAGWVQIWQREYEGLCDPRGWWQVNSPGSEEQWNEQLCKPWFNIAYIITSITKGASVPSSFRLLLNRMCVTPPLRWNTKTSMKRQRVSTWQSRTLLRSSTPSLCAISHQRSVHHFLIPHENIFKSAENI